MQQEDIKPEFNSIVFINKKRELCEIIDFGDDIVEYVIDGIVENEVFGVYFNYMRKRTLKKRIK